MEFLSPEEEMLKIRDIAISSQTQIKEGDLFYLIAQRWWQQWIDYVNHDRIVDVSSSFDDSDIAGSVMLRRPHGIDNSELIFDTPSDEIELHDKLVEGRDYVLLPEDVWNQLYLWYGGGPTLERKVIKCFLPQMELMVEVFPLRLCLTVLPKGGSSTIRISKKDCVGELHRRSCEIFELSKERVCIWDYFGHQKRALMKDMDKTLDDFNIQTGQDILVEVDNETNGVCLAASKNGSRSCSSDISQSQSLNSPITDLDNSYGVSSGVSTRGSSGGGLTGLLNLGNTCFMNSAIQCLVHTPQFAAYFQDDFYREINWNNPLGMVGELALAFGELLRKLWAPSRTPVSPRPFKSKLARFAPQFNGYNQHDSQELLAFLLDGLHEDLNRVKERPYVKSKDANDRPDEEVANEYWANHIARNDSIIVDVCQGQYKSTLVCPVCGKVSVTFDPFMYLSLPLQSAATRIMTVTVFTCDGSALPDICTLTVPKLGRCRDLIQALSSACSLDPTQKFLLVEIKGHLIHRFLEDPFIQLSAIRDEEHLAAYKIPKLPKNIIFLQLVHRREEQVTSGTQGKLLWTPYGTPLVSPISCDEVVTRRDLRLTVLKMLSPLRSRTEKVGDADISISSASSSTVGEGGNPKKSHNLPLQLVDVDNACIDLSICDEKVVKLSPAETSMLIFMNWSGKLLEEYETHYLEDLQPVSKNVPTTKKTRSELLSLYSCLDAFLREEPLVPEDMWYCPHCEEMRQASKKLDLWRLPEVLVIHLKRFSYSRSMKHKLETFVNFPVHHFDLTNYVAHDKTGSHHEIYDLYALTNHYGGMGSGHYTAHIKMMENKWYNFDDNHISCISADEVKSAAAYVLFYRRVKT